MELRSAGRSQRNPTSGERRSTIRQRRGLAIPPGEEITSVETYVLWLKAVAHAVLWVGGVVLVVVLHNEWDWVGLSLLFLSGAALASEARWRAPRTRTSKEG